MVCGPVRRAESAIIREEENWMGGFGPAWDIGGRMEWRFEEEEGAAILPGFYDCTPVGLICLRLLGKGRPTDSFMDVVSTMGTGSLLPTSQVKGYPRRKSN